MVINLCGHAILTGKDAKKFRKVMAKPTDPGRREALRKESEEFWELMKKRKEEDKL